MHIEVIMYAFAIVSEFILPLNFIFTVFLLGLFILTGYNILSFQSGHLKKVFKIPKQTSIEKKWYPLIK